MEQKKKTESAIPNNAEKKKEVMTAIPTDEEKLSPSVKKILEENNLKATKIKTTRNDGRLTKADVLKYMKEYFHQYLLQKMKQ